MQAELFAYHIVAGITEYRGYKENHHDNFDIHALGCSCCESTAGEEQRITGQERGDNKTGFAEDYEKQNSVNELAIGCHDFRQVLVQM